MQIPKLSPLQSRLLASVIATCILVVIWISFQPHNFVYAAELPDPLAARDLRYGDLGIVVPRARASEFGVELEAEKEKEDGEVEIEAQARGKQVENEVDSDSGRVGIESEVERAEIKERGEVYTSDFSYFHHNLGGRQEEQANEKLTNNEKKEMDTDPGTTKNFVMERSQLRLQRLELRGSDEDEQEDETDAFGGQLKRRQAGRVWISASTCRAPNPTTKLITDPLPQLTLYISTSTKNQQPGPRATNDLATEPILFEKGFANFSLEANSDVYIGISAPELAQGWNGSWHFEIAASVDGYYHVYNNNTSFTFIIDTDSESTLFITRNLSTSNTSAEFDKWQKMPNPFSLYAFPNDTWTSITGLEHSFCALQNSINSTKDANITVQKTMTKKFGLDLPKGQFHVQGLKNNKTYLGYLAMAGMQNAPQIPIAGTVGGGGMVFAEFNWTTKVEDSCQVLFDLDFCDTVAYAVPSSSEFKFDDDRLKAFYDDQARTYMENFNKSLAQVACNTTSTAQYSLARNCTDCHNDYKNWLCSVLIPRCEDWSATDEWLQPRNINAKLIDGQIPFKDNMTTDFNKTMRDRFAFSKSRNPKIDEVIQPGPYKEILPCEDLCFDIVRSCPAQLGFACPNQPARKFTYGKRDADPFKLKCNFPGAVVSLDMFQGAAPRTLGLSFRIVSVVAGLVSLLLWI